MSSWVRAPTVNPTEQRLSHLGVFALGASHLRHRPSSPWPDELFGPAAHEATLFLLSKQGGRLAVDPRRWHDDPGDADLALLRRARGPVLDIGCGPGRLVGALVRSGRVALGIDTSAAAVTAARRRGAPAVHTSVFGPVPLAGGWGTALLLDGNVGIGGDVRLLLSRTARLIEPDGVILVEVESPDATSEDIELRVDHGGRLGRWFPWSRITAGDLPAVAESAGLALDELWQHSGRWFAKLASGIGMEPQMEQQKAAS
jgi:SAM-dependent methyltransferase